MNQVTLYQTKTVLYKQYFNMTAWKLQNQQNSLIIVVVPP